MLTTQITAFIRITEKEESKIPYTMKNTQPKVLTLLINMVPLYDVVLASIDIKTIPEAIIPINSINSFVILFFPLSA